MATPLVLELMGAPGSGKTTVARRLEDEPGLVVVKDHEIGDLPVLLRGLLTALPVLGADPGLGISRVRWAAWAGRVAAAPDVVGRRLHRGARLVVLDQGPAYTLGRMASARRSPAVTTWWEERLRSCADLLGGVVLLDADAATLRDRVRARPKHHAARDLAAEAALTMLQEEREGCREMAEQLERRGVPVVRMDTTSINVDGQLRALRDILFGQPSADA